MKTRDLCKTVWRNGSSILPFFSFFPWLAVTLSFDFNQLLSCCHGKDVLTTNAQNVLAYGLTLPRDLLHLLESCSFVLSSVATWTGQIGEEVGVFVKQLWSWGLSARLAKTGIVLVVQFVWTCHFLWTSQPQLESELLTGYCLLATRWRLDVIIGGMERELWQLMIFSPWRSPNISHLIPWSGCQLHNCIMLEMPWMLVSEILSER